jgi:hypothetical protein
VTESAFLQRKFMGKGILAKILCLAVVAPAAGATPRLIQECLRKHAYTSVLVEHGQSEDCGNEMHLSPVFYRINAERDRVSIDLYVNFVSDGTFYEMFSTKPARAKFIFSQFQKCIPLLKKSWAEMGLEIHPHFRLNDERGTGVVNPHEVFLADEVGSSDTTIFFRDYLSYRKYQKKYCVQDSLSCKRAYQMESAQDRCSMLVHELGHLMGLQDEYPDPACPRRKLPGPEFPLSFMSSGGFRWGKRSFKTRHVLQVLAPLCGKPERPTGTKL